MINTLYTKSAILFGAISLAGGATGQDVTNLEREQALHYLAETRAGVIEAVKGLSDAQFNFKPAPDRWSVAECLEHIAIVEDLALNGIRPRLEKSPGARGRSGYEANRCHGAGESAGSLNQNPSTAAASTHRRARLPLRRWIISSPAVSRAVNWLKSDSDLRGHVVDHPVLGPLDGYQWILAVAAHSERHTKQILEVKADPNFPGTE